MNTATLDPSDRLRVSTRVTLLGVAVNLVLTGAKLIVGVISHSQALVADGIHSLSDLVGDGLVLLATSHANKAPDSSHPYGHQRIETAAAMLLGFALMMTAGAIAWGAVGRLQMPGGGDVPGQYALWVAAFSILANEMLYQITARAADTVQSNLLRANAWHHRTDSISSVVVLIGLAGSMLGLPILDPIAAGAVAMMIAKVGWEFAWQSVRELTDTGLDRTRIKGIRSIIKSVDGVEGMHMLRSRKLGEQALVDVHVIVNPEISVSEGHRIADRIRQQVLRQQDGIEDVLVHVDSEDDESQEMGKFLPLRDQVERVVRAAIAATPVDPDKTDIVLHYEKDKIHLEFRLPVSVISDLGQGQELAEALKTAVTDLPHLGRVQVSFYQ
ncbi:MAG: cation diffusion facilitator family transporter [Immundisolibacteraceae bacterium]|nr:cation diffusion facilitator family transporter [Immundisolibacteraceae bacterium]